jgi:hypothetical protein
MELQCRPRVRRAPNPLGRVWDAGGRLYCFSYSPFPTFFRMVNPAFFASLTDNGLEIFGVLKFEITLRTGFLQSGQCSNAGRLIGRFN